MKHAANLHMIISEKLQARIEKFIQSKTITGYPTGSKAGWIRYLIVKGLESEKA